jgi:hypothetical protein
MGLLQVLERILIRSKHKKQMDLKEIYFKPKGLQALNTYRTTAVGTEYTNLDSSERQEALQKLKEGESVRLIWHPGGSEKKDTVYLVRGGHNQRLSMVDCFGRLNDKMAGNVIRWLTQDNILTTAKIIKIMGGSRKRPKLGCVLELTTYQGPDDADK